MEGDKCNLHPKEQIRLICREIGCNLQPLCPMCIPNHFKHAIVNIEDYWKGKLEKIDSADIEQELKEEILIGPNNHEEHILTTCEEIKKYILKWGRMLESKIAKSISTDVKSMIKSINNYENGIMNNIQEKGFDKSKIMKNTEQNKKYKNKMKKALNSNKFSLINSYYKELTKREKETKDIMQKMKKKGKNMISEIIIEEMKKKTEKGIKELFEHINQVLYDQKVDLKGLKGTLKKVEEKKVENIPKVEEKKVKKIPKIEEKKEKTPKREKQHIFQGIISASYDKSLIFWDKEYKQKSTHKGNSYYTKLIELSSGGIAATTGDPEYSVEILGNNLELLSTLRGHTGYVYDICNMGERNIITGSADKTVRIWDIRSGECSQILKGHTGYVYCVHLHSKSGYLLTGSDDQTVRIWDITNTPQSYKEIAQILHKQGAWVYDLVELDDGRMLSLCHYSSSLGVKVWELREKGRVNTLKDIPCPKQEKEGFICGLWISGTKGVLLGGELGNLMLFDVATYALSPLIDNLHKNWIIQIKGIKDDIYVTCSNDKSIKIVNIITKKVLQTLRGHTEYVRSILPIFAEDKE